MLSSVSILAELQMRFFAITTAPYCYQEEQGCDFEGEHIDSHPAGSNIFELR